MAETLTIRTASSTEVVKIAVPGPQGATGQGVPVGGSTGQVLRKKTGTDYDTEWAAAGSGSGSVTSVALASTDLTISGSPITTSGTITANIAANAVTLEKLQTISSEHLLGRHGSGNGGVQQVGLGTGLAISGSNVRVATTGITAGTYTKLTVDETGRATVGATATPSDIGAQSLFTTTNYNITGSGSFTLTADRAQIAIIENYSGAKTVTLPTSGNQSGDIAVVRANPSIGTLTVAGAVGGSQTIPTTGSRRYVYDGTNWQRDPVYTHEHEASDITSGTLAYARGGLAADVSAYNGLVKISGGSTSAVTVTSAGEALLDDADAAAQRTTLGLGTAATAATGDFAAASHTHTASAISDSTTAGRALLTAADAAAQRTSLGLGTAATSASSAFAAASHSHELTALAATGATNGHVLTANGSGGVTFAAASGGVSAVDATTADVFSVSGSNLVADDGGLIDSANPFVQWNDTSGKLVYANPLSRPSGAFYVGVAPTTTALGTRAINIQADRSLAADRVAQGTDCVVIGNSAQTGNISGATAIGFRARANTTYATCIGGESVASGNASIAIGAVSTASGAQSINISAYDAYGGNSSSATNSVGLNATADLRAMFATAAFRSVYWGGQTTNNTATILNLDTTATNRFTIAANTALAVDILLVARRSDVADKWLVARRFLGIRRDGSNNTSLIGAVQTLGTDQSAGSPTWTFTLSSDDVNEALQLEVVGATGETVQWRACAIYRVV